jgi:hypothetical protein
MKNPGQKQSGESNPEQLPAERISEKEESVKRGSDGAI